MPFSFAHLFLGKKATVIDEDSLPCQPREIVPVAVDAKPVTFKTKFGLTKIGRALKHKLHLHTAYTIPSGHGPLVVAADEPFMPFSQCLQSPTTPSFQSLPHIPDVSSTLRRDFRNATRFALLAAAEEEANSLASSNDIYISTPCRKRRTRSSSVLGGSELPRPETPLDFQNHGPQNQGHERDGLASPIRSFLITPIDSPVIWENDDVSAYSSEYNEVPAVLPLALVEENARFLRPFIGLADIRTAYPSPANNWYTQKYLHSNANWSMPVLPTSRPPSSPHESYPELPKLDFGPRKGLPASSVYSSFTPGHDKNTKSSSNSLLSPQYPRLSTYSPIKRGEQVRMFPRTYKESPPADEAAREAQRHDTPECSLVETADARSDLLDDEEYRSTSEVFYNGVDVDNDDDDDGNDHITTKVPTSLLEYVLEPKSSHFPFGSIAETLADTSEDSTETLAVLQRAAYGRNSRHFAATGASSTAMIHVQFPKRDTRCCHLNSLVLRQLSESAADSILRIGAERRVQVIAKGLSRFISGFDLFASEQQHGLIQTVGKSGSCLASSAENSAEAPETQPEQVSTRKPASICAGSFKYPFNPDVYDTKVGDVLSMRDTTNSPGSLHAPPQKQKVTFAKVRRTITIGGTMGEEQEGMNDDTSTKQEMLSSRSVNLLAEWPDLEDNWHHEDQDFLHIGEHVSDHEISRKDRRRERATQFAISCLQNSLASANTRLMKIAPLEQALEQRHQSHLDTEKRNTELVQEVSALKAEVDAGKVVFDRMMSEKLIEIASKNEEVDTLRALRDDEPVTEQLTELHETLRELRKGKLEYLRIAEEYSQLLKRADDRQCLAEQEAQTAKVAQSFAAINQQCAEEYHENLKERILELEIERDQAFKARDCALSEAREWQDEHAAHGHRVTEPGVSTTPAGSPSGHHGDQDYASDSETSEPGVESGEEFRAPTEGVTEELEDWDDSDIF